ncbi:MAG: ATP-binding protein [Opitutaceae bacterium]|nr:ATP-binding protein [Opitutaceae bacterium]
MNASTQAPPLEPTIPVGLKRTALAKAAFSVSARVAMQLGRESISSSNTAIVELVKNAYDADADWVKIRFAGLGTAKPRMLIEDNGQGMTEGELRENWLCIGTTNKQQVGKSGKKGRVQTGEKGLGRLGLDRLCHRSVLQSLRRVEDEDTMPVSAEMFPDVKRCAIELDIQWDRYQAAGRRLETIEHDIGFIEHLNFDALTLQSAEFPHGTRLLLEGLKDDWTHARIAELGDELALLLSPFGRPEDFSIYIDSGQNWKDVDGPVLPPSTLLELANWKVDAAIESADEDERVSIRMTSSMHERAFLPEPALWSDFTKHKNQTMAADLPRKSRCGPLKLQFYVFIRDADELAKRGSGLSEISDFLESNRGIRIYRDGFRVKPYGDPSGQNDWLTLSLRRAVNPAAISRANWKVGFHQVVGAVFITKEGNPELIDQTNREGIVEGRAFDDMRVFADKVVQYFEGRAHQDAMAQAPRPEPVEEPPGRSSERAAEALDQIDDAVKGMQGGPMLLTSQGSPAPEADRAQQIAEAVQKVKAELANAEGQRKAQDALLAELKEEVSVLTSLASLGIMTASFGHERVNDATEVLNDAARLKAYVENPQGTLFSKEDQLAMLAHLAAGAQRIDAFAKFALDHVRPRKRIRQGAKLKPVVERTLRVFDELLCGRFGAKVTQSIPDNDEFDVPGWEAGWESVLVNMITNASWALSKTPVANRKISIALAREGDEVVMTFQDSGVGLEAGTEEDIFRPGVSTKSDEHGRIIGTGMGLTIVHSFITANKGAIRPTAHSPLGGAGFEIRVPRLQPRPS